MKNLITQTIAVRIAVVGRVIEIAMAGRRKRDLKTMVSDRKGIRKFLSRT